MITLCYHRGVTLTCADCGVNEEYESQTGARRKLCQPCARARRHGSAVAWRARAAATPGRPRAFLRHQHGMTEGDYSAMLLAQGGLCAGCQRPAPVAGKNLHVDHDHACCPSNRSCHSCRRGLLCAECNMALGLLRDNTDTLARLVEYLDR